MLVDALVIRVRLDGRVRQRSLLLATGVSREGYRHLLGLHLGDKESEASWGSFFAALKQRGLTGVDLVVSDSHSGLVNAIHTHFQGAVWQRCQTNAAPLQVMRIVDDTGRLLRRANQAPDEVLRLDFTASQEGTYCLEVRDVLRNGGWASAYRLEVLDRPPAPLVVANVEGLTVPRETFQIVPLTVTRNGHAGPIALTLTGAPPGVTLTPSEVPEGVAAFAGLRC